MKTQLVALLCLFACVTATVSVVPVPDIESEGPEYVTPEPVESIGTQSSIAELETPRSISATPDSHSPDDLEAVMLAKTMYAEASVPRWFGYKFGVSYRARQAAVAWVALNRVDAGGFGEDLCEVLTRPHQFAYDPDAPVTDELLELAWDVLHRWRAEKDGETDVGRTIPPEYLYFEGDGKENYFRTEYQNTGDVWDWSLPDPYKEG